MINAFGVVCRDDERMELAVEVLRSEGEIVLVANDLGDLEIRFIEVFRGVRKIDAATGCSGHLAQGCLSGLQSRLDICICGASLFFAQTPMMFGGLC